MPEENIGPSPRRTTTRTDSSWQASSNASPSAWQSSSLRALRFSALFITTCRTAPRSSVSTSAMYPPSALDLKEAIERARAGGPERHHEKSEQQGKLPVRERIARLVDEGSFT